MSTSIKGRGGWALLAAAIIKSGVQCNDQEFLESDWCQALRDIIDLSNKNEKSDSFFENINHSQLITYN